jgi:hypothetical protein
VDPVADKEEWNREINREVEDERCKWEEEADQHEQEFHARLAKWKEMHSKKDFICKLYIYW